MSNSVLSIFQLSDTHLFSDRRRRLKGVLTYDTLEAVVELARERLDRGERQGSQSAAGEALRHSELAILTGDLTHDESPEAYENVARLVSRLGLTTYFLSGNHDIGELAEEQLPAHPGFEPEKLIDLGEWRLVLLDSNLPGRVEGALGAAEMERLAESLDSAAGRHVAVFLHHNPVNLYPPRPDRMMLQDADAFFALLDRFENVRCVVWGHVHQEFAALRKGVLLMAAPSTCIQFRPSEGGVMLDRAAPGFRNIRLYGDGSVDTTVIRLPELPEGLVVTSEEL